MMKRVLTSAAGLLLLAAPINADTSDSDSGTARCETVSGPSPEASLCSANRQIAFTARPEDSRGDDELRGVLAERLAAHDPTGARRIKTSIRRAGLDPTVADRGDGAAEAWFRRALEADPLAGRRMRPVAATDS